MARRMPRTGGTTEGADAFAEKANKLKVPVSQLVIGMYVCELDRPWLDSPFLFQGFPLQSPEDIEAVQGVCSYVYVDVQLSTEETRKRLTRPPAAPVVVTEEIRPVRRGSEATASVRRLLSRIGRRIVRHSIPLKTVHSLHVARKPLDETARFLRETLEDVRSGMSIDLPTAREAIAGCAEQIVHHPAAVMLLGSIRDKDQYTAQHSLSVGLLAMLLGNRLRFPRSELVELGICGALHDVGKIRMPDAILKKPGRLTYEEFEVMKRHPGEGREILESSEGVFRRALDVAHEHHERLDGSGYPRGLTASEMGLFSRVVAMVDTYDAITSDRAYAQGRTHLEAINVLKAASGNSYDGDLVGSFVEVLGVFPVGSAVELSDGSFAVVVKGNPRSPFRPSVLVLKDPDGQSIEPLFQDLAKPSRRNKSALTVTRMVRHEECGIDARAFRDRAFLDSLR